MQPIINGNETKTMYNNGERKFVYVNDNPSVIDHYTMVSNSTLKLNVKNELIIFESSNNNVATIDKYGVVSSHGEGTTSLRVVDIKGNCHNIIINVNKFKKIKNSDLKNSIMKVNKSNYDPNTKSIPQKYLNDKGIVFGGATVVDKDGIHLNGTGNYQTNGLKDYRQDGNICRDYFLSFTFKLHSLPIHNIWLQQAMGITTDGYLVLGQQSLRKLDKINLNESVTFSAYIGNFNGGWKIKAYCKNSSLELPYDVKDLVYELSLANADITIEDITVVKSVGSEINKIDAVANYLVNGGNNIVCPTISAQSRRVQGDSGLKDLTLLLDINDSNINPDIPTYRDDELTYDLEEYTYDGKLLKVYEGILRGGHNELTIMNVDKTPIKEYKYFIIKSPYNLDSNSIYQIQFDITDSSKKDDPTISGIYMFPNRVIGRVGDIRLIQPSFIPHKIGFQKVTCESSDPLVASVDNSGVINCKKVGKCNIHVVSVSDPSLTADVPVEVIPDITSQETTTIDIASYGIIVGDKTPSVALNNLRQLSKAFSDKRKEGFKKIKVPAGHYYVDTNNAGEVIQIPDHVVIDLTDCIIEQLPCEGADTSVFRTDFADGSMILNGEIIGDKITHDYGVRINEDGQLFEVGCIDHRDGTTLVDKSTIDGTVGVRTKEFIEYSTANTTEGFKIIPLWNTTMNTVDGGRALVYWYREDGSFISYVDKEFIAEANHIPPEGATKFKIVLRSEKRTDCVFALTKRKVHYTYEFGFGVNVCNAFDFEIRGTKIRDCTGDCICTTDRRVGVLGDVLDVVVSDTRFVNCTLEGSRRQGISYTGNGETNLVYGCNIGNIAGTDPQAGIDYEHYGFCKNNVITKSRFYKNRKWDIISYNGTDIDAYDNDFDGGFGDTYGKNYYFHDNRFIYDDKLLEEPEGYNSKIHNFTGMGLSSGKTNAYCISENNTVNGGTGKHAVHNIGVSNLVHTGSINDHVSYSKCNLAGCGGVTEYIGSEFNNSNIYTKGPIAGKVLQDLKFTNTDITDENGCIFDNATLVSSKIVASNKKLCTIRNSTLKEYSNDGNGTGSIYFKDCTINNTIKSFVSGQCFYNFTVENCDITLPRERLGIIYKGGILFKNCRFTFLDGTNPDTSLNFVWYGYGTARCACGFLDCTFTSNQPVSIGGDHVKNCTGNENIKFGTLASLTDFEITQLKFEPSSAWQSLNITYTPSSAVDKFLVYEAPAGSGIEFNQDYSVGDKIKVPKVGNFTITAKNIFGDIVKQYQIVVEDLPSGI